MQFGIRVIPSNIPSVIAYSVTLDHLHPNNENQLGNFFSPRRHQTIKMSSYPELKYFNSVQLNPPCVLWSCNGNQNAHKHQLEPRPGSHQVFLSYSFIKKQTKSDFNTYFNHCWYWKTKQSTVHIKTKNFHLTKNVWKNRNWPFKVRVGFKSEYLLSFTCLPFMC